MIRHHQVKPYLRRPQILKHVEIIKVSEIPTYDTSFEISTWGSQILNITMIRQNYVKLYHLKAQSLKYVEITKASNKPTQDTSLERF